MRTGDFLYVVGNTRRTIVFAQKKVSIEVNPRMEVTL